MIYLVVTRLNLPGTESRNQALVRKENPEITDLPLQGMTGEDYSANWSHIELPGRDASLLALRS